MIRSLASSILLALNLPVLASAQTPQWGVAATYPLTLQAIRGMDVGDLNLDGRLDVIVRGDGDGVIASGAVMLGQPDGTFSVQYLPENGITGIYGNALAIGLLDGDNIPDVMSDRIRHGNGDGTFVLSSLPPLAGMEDPQSAAIADANADGRPDIICGFSSGHVRIALAAPQGGFLLPLSYGIGCLPQHVVVGDADGDGDVDVAASCNGGLTVLFNQLNLGFVAQSYGRDGLSRPALEDFTGDGLPDMFNTRRLLVGVGGGMFLPGNPEPAVDYGWYEALDCDGDGRPDFVAPSLGPTGQIVVARNLGSGSFDTGCRVPNPGGGGPRYIRTGSVLGDARPEILALDGLNRVLVLRNLAPDCNNNGIDDPVEIANGMTTDCNGNGVPDACDGDCDANGLADPCQIAANPAEDLDADGTLDICEIAGVPFCFGDGTGNACPCDPGQAGSTGSGCRNSGGNGARLEARGNPSVSVDSVTLRATGVLPTAIGLLFQGNGQQAGGLGGTFGDGLLCVNQNVLRLGLRNASGGSVAFGYSVPGDVRIAVAGQVPGSGATRYYQHWYRDPAPFCTAGTFNLTNAVRIDWVP